MNVKVFGFENDEVLSERVQKLPVVAVHEHESNLKPGMFRWLECGE